MIYRIKEKFWSWGDDFSITDPDGNPVYHIDGAAFSWGDKLSFQEMSGQELAFIRQRMMSWKPTYEIHIGGQVFAEVTKEWTWFNKKFTLDVPGPNDFTIEGSFWLHEYTFLRSGRLAATVSKSYWSWTDSYGVEIVEDDQVVPILCACIVIDQVLHDEKQ